MENGQLALLVGVGLAVALLGLLALLGFLGGFGIVRRLILGEQAGRTHEEGQAEHQGHEFLHFEISLGVRSYVDNFTSIISAGHEPKLKRVLKTFHLGSW
jgi:hypothetical protein